MNIAGYTPLALALRLRDPHPFQVLLEAGADVTTIASPTGATVLEMLNDLNSAYRHRQWSMVVEGASPQPWHALRSLGK